MRVESRTLQRVHKRLDLLPDRITEGSKEAVQESGEAIREQVERTVRVNTGRLKERIRVRLVGTKGLTADVGWFDKDTYYAQYQEFGTSKITADPVLTRAGVEEEARFPKRLREHIQGKL
jgi:HK97 gp10 family phage protein